MLGDLSLAVDGHSLAPQLISRQLPAIQEMKEGRARSKSSFRPICLRAVPTGASPSKIVHQSGIAAYQVNCLVPRDAEIQILAQKRNDSQSHYELDYIQTSDRSASRLSAWWSDGRKWVGALALLLAGRSTALWRRRSRAAEEVAVAPTRTAM